jgi:hypothetical protein
MENEKQKFLDYERIRQSGVTNMFDVRTVCLCSFEDLTREDCLYIMKNYAELAEKYLGGER